MDDGKRRQIREIALKELEKGKTPNELLALAVSAGLPREALLEEFTRLAETPDFAFAGVLTNFLQKGSKPKPENPKKSDKLWDPAGEEITRFSFHGLRQELENKAKAYAENPSIPRWNLTISCIPLILTAVLLLLSPHLITSLATYGEGDGVYLLFLAFAPPALYIRHVFKIQRSLIKMMIANAQGWLFAPAERTERWHELNKKYPEIFQKGNKDQNIQDEFWGTTRFGSDSADFWSGIFVYVIESQGEKGKRNRQTKYCNVFALRLPKPLKCDFRLEPENLATKIRSWFSRKEINTESADFNRTFAVFYDGKKVDEQLEIVKTLSPSVQVRLLEMKEKFGKFVLLFRDDVVVISFPGKLLKRMNTNFFRQVAVDPRDKEAMLGRLNNVLDVSCDIVRFLD